MDLAAVQTLYKDAITSHLRGMGLSETVAEFEADRIFHRWINKD